MFTSLMMLAAEANGVVALRMMKLMRGGKSARSEADLMVREKIDAALRRIGPTNGWRFGRDNSPWISEPSCGKREAVEQAQFGPKAKEKTTSKIVNLKHHAETVARAHFALSHLAFI